MTATIADPIPPDSTTDSATGPARRSLTVISLMLLSAWCGLVAGLLEVGATIVRKQLFDPNHLYGQSHHFTWLLPVTNLAMFLTFGFIGCLATSIWPGIGRRIFLRLLCALTLLPALIVSLSQIYTLAWLLVTIGFAIRLVPWLERHRVRFRRVVLLSSPLIVTTVLLLWAVPWFAARARQSAENAGSPPPPGAPNLLLIVMDTVAAGHTSLSGYSRPTTTTLAELAEHAIRFDAAQSAAPWTLASHATMFTGRWLHELGVGWLTPLDRTFPTLAEYLGQSGYATAGFVGNNLYAARDSGLSRGFTTYEDFIFPRLTAFKKTALVDRALQGIQIMGNLLREQFELEVFEPAFDLLSEWFSIDRKSASLINHELLDWLSARPQPARPFVAFLNYFDAHNPYQLPPKSFHRFGANVSDTRQVAMLEQWDDLDKKNLSPEELEFAAKSYDECVADLDEQIGWLLDKLRRDGVLQHTWVIITADHGESFGEHKDVFCHGTSLYQTEIHVPLIIVPPGGLATQQVVQESASLRDLPATVVEILGLKHASPFPGHSLARHWDKTAVDRAPPVDPVLAEVVPNPNDPSIRDPSGKPVTPWPLGALSAGGWSYIRRELEKREELFQLSNDPGQQRNQAADPAVRETLDQMRAMLRRATAGPLTLERFRP